MAAHYSQHWQHTIGLDCITRYNAVATMNWKRRSSQGLRARLETEMFSRLACQVAKLRALGKQLAAWSAVVNRLHKGSAVED